MWACSCRRRALTRLQVVKSVHSVLAWGRRCHSPDARHFFSAYPKKDQELMWPSGISGFLKMGHPGLFLFYFRAFQTNIDTMFTTKQCEKCPSSIRRQDLNPRPFEHELSPITARPELMWPSGISGCLVNWRCEFESRSSPFLSFRFWHVLNPNFFATTAGPIITHSFKI